MTDPPGDRHDRLAEAERALAEAGTGLVEALGRAVPGWVEQSVRRVADAAGIRVDPEAVGRAAVAARDEVVERLARLVVTDPDEQRTTPMQVVRAVVAHPTAVLAEAETPASPRDAVAVEQFPDDAYDLTPAGLGELSDEAHEAGLRWGVARAMVHRLRHEA